MVPETFESGNSPIPPTMSYPLRCPAPLQGENSDQSWRFGDSEERGIEAKGCQIHGTFTTSRCMFTPPWIQQKKHPSFSWKWTVSLEFDRLLLGQKAYFWTLLLLISGSVTCWQIKSELSLYIQYFCLLSVNRVFLLQIVFLLNITYSYIYIYIHVTYNLKKTARWSDFTNLPACGDLRFANRISIICKQLMVFK